ncbi:MAG: GGDEF domain-containing protein, partial [Nitrospiraceae bacterium]
FAINGTSIHLTVSMGIARVPDPHIVTVEEAVASADAALYQAKSHGRNRVEAFEEGTQVAPPLSLSMQSSANPARVGVR